VADFSTAAYIPFPRKNPSENHDLPSSATTVV
jgi:hypothetical protein